MTIHVECNQHMICDRGDKYLRKKNQPKILFVLLTSLRQTFLFPSANIFNFPTVIVFDKCAGKIN